MNGNKYLNFYKGLSISDNSEEIGYVLLTI